MQTLFENLYNLHMISAFVFAVLVWIAAGLWYVRMRKSGGLAGLFYQVFFFLIGLFAISEVPYVSATNLADATHWGALGLIFGLTAWFMLFLSGEYSTSDRPASWRLATIGILYGFCAFGLSLNFLFPPGMGYVIMTYISGYGWTLSLMPAFFPPIALLTIGSFGMFSQFCVKVFRAAPKTPLGHKVHQFIYAIAAGLGTVTIASMIRFLFREIAMFIPFFELFLAAAFLMWVFTLIYRDNRIIFLLPNKATCLFVLNTAGIVYYEHAFDKGGITANYIDLFAPALTAVNYIVQESLELQEVEWIQEFSTDERTFLIDVRLEADLVGVLLVDKPTQILRQGLSRFMAGLITAFSARGNKQMDFNQDMQLEVNDILKHFNEDIAGLRRDLVDARLLGRERDGSRYWRTEN